MEILPDQAQYIFTVTEGWVSGLQLAGLSLKRHPASNWLKATPFAHDQFVTGYLKDEVLKVQNENIQTFLLQTSILHRFNADLCQSITGMEDAREILKELEQNNIFITPLDATHEWYRYHPLFAESLKIHLNDTRKTTVPSLDKKAALWYAEKHFFEDAFYHGQSSGDMNFLSSLVEEHLFFYLLSCEFILCQRWLEKLPKEILQERLILLIYQQMLAVSQWDLPQADLLMTDIKE